MTRKATYGTMMTLLAICMLVTVPPVAQANSVTALSVEPAHISANPGQTFAVNITVKDVVDLAGFEFNMTFDPDILNVTDIDMGPFFPQYLVWKNQSWWYDPSYEEPLPSGTIWFSATLPLGTPQGGGKSGNGTLVIITFIVKPEATGTSPLNLWNTLLGTSQQPPTYIQHEVYDGIFSIGLPIADFDYSPSEPHVGDEITFNASKSYKPGGTIVIYEWDLGDGTAKIYIEGVNLTDITMHSYSEAKDYSVKLTVTDNFGLKGSIEKTIKVRTEIPPPTVVTATIDIDPDTLNLKSKGKWITAYIELPEGYTVGDIDISTVKLNGEISAELHPTELSDYDEDGIPDLMVKFDRQALIQLLSAEESTLTITGEVNGTPFKGSDTTRVIIK